MAAVPTKQVTCKHCGGSSRCTCNHCAKNSALGLAETCKACKGTGKVRVSKDATTCPHCGGATRCACPTCGDGLGHAALCHACKGKGLV